MKLFGLRVHVVLAVCALGLLVAYGGRYVYVERQIEAPLESELRALAGVEEARLEAGPGGAYRVTVRVASDVRLSDLYRAVRERVDARLGPLAMVDLEDRRSPELVAAWDAVGFALQEGAATGRLEAMRQRVEALAADLGVETRLYVDESRIYVTLEKGGRYLHEVIRRQPAASGSYPAAGGGGE